MTISLFQKMSSKKQSNLQSFFKSSSSTSISTPQENIEHSSNNTDSLVHESAEHSNSLVNYSTRDIFNYIKKVLTQNEIQEVLNKIWMPDENFSFPTKAVIVGKEKNQDF